MLHPFNPVNTVRGFVTENFWSQSYSLRNLSGVIWTILVYNTPNLAYLGTLVKLISQLSIAKIQFHF